jgi:abortive infection bacteriophage resistance protein
MHYTKKPLKIEQQIKKLKSRGLLINDEKSAGNYLSNISYYRLRAYTFPFQDNDSQENDHCFFRNNIHFEDIIDLYCFDRRLRVLIFNARKN